MITLVVFLILLATGLYLSLARHPAYGVMVYVGCYHFNPLVHWWSYIIAPLFMSVSYSMVIGVVVLASFVLAAKRLRVMLPMMLHEWLLLALVASVVVSPMVAPFGIQDWDFVVKMVKMGGILLLATHCVTTRRYYLLLLVVMLGVSFYAAHTHQARAGTSFVEGRLNSGLGGPDYSETNFLAAHHAAMLPLLGIFFLRGSWKVKALCVVAGAFMANTVVLTRSRGAYLALAAAGVFSLLTVGRLKAVRNKLLGLMLLAGVGLVFLVDDHFWARMGTITTSEEEMEGSASGRLEAWRGAVEMAFDWPLGVGAGMFASFVSDYTGFVLDTHNTYLRCLAELGFHGAAILVALVANAFLVLSRVSRRAYTLEGDAGMFYSMHAYGLRVGLFIYVVTSLLISATYVEDFYWLLSLPVMLLRSLEAEIADSQEDGDEAGAGAVS